MSENQDMVSREVYEAALREIARLEELIRKSRVPPGAAAAVGAPEPSETAIDAALHVLECESHPKRPGSTEQDNAWYGMPTHHEDLELIRRVLERAYAVDFRGVPSQPVGAAEPSEAAPTEAQIDAAEAWYFGTAHPPERAIMRPFIRGMARAILQVGRGVPSREGEDYAAAVREIAQLEVNVTDLRRSHEIADRENDQLRARLARAEEVIRGARRLAENHEFAASRNALAGYDASTGAGSETP